MNPSDEKTPNIDPQWLEVLVDGELAEPDRRELLNRLEHTPGGWRACALAFLESQCLGESFAAGLPERTMTPPQTAFSPAPPAHRARSPWVRRAGGFLAMAASLLAAVSAGWWAGGGRRAGEVVRAPGPGPSLAAVQQGPATAGPTQPVSPSAPVMTVALPAVGDDGRQFRLPVVERDHLDQSLLYPDSQGLPSQLREALRRAGYQVRQSHQLLPVPVEDGRHAVVPVDQLDVHYVGNHVE